MTDTTDVFTSQLCAMNLSQLKAMRTAGLKTDPTNEQRRLAINEEIRRKEGLADDEAEIAGFEEEKRRKADEKATAKARIINRDAAKAALQIAADASQKFHEHIHGLVTTYTAVKNADGEARGYLRAAGIEVGPDDGMTFLLELALNNDLLGMKLPVRQIGYDKDRPALRDVVSGECRTMADAIARDEKITAGKAAA